MESERMKKFRERGLIGCLNETDVSSENYKDFIYQPERSKREDFDDLGHAFTGIPTTEESWCEKCGEEDHVIKKSRMRCSEH